jgi:hypothetical protein
MDKLKLWIDTHPTIKGGLVAAESAVAAVAGTALTNLFNGQEQLTMASLKKLGTFFVITAGTAFWNYVKTSPSDTAARNETDALKASAIAAANAPTKS